MSADASPGTLEVSFLTCVCQRGTDVVVWVGCTDEELSCPPSTPHPHLDRGGGVIPPTHQQAGAPAGRAGELGGCSPAHRALRGPGAVQRGGGEGERGGGKGASKNAKPPGKRMKPRPAAGEAEVPWAVCARPSFPRVKVPGARCKGVKRRHWDASCPPRGRMPSAPLLCSLHPSEPASILHAGPDGPHAGGSF